MITKEQSQIFAEQDLENSLIGLPAPDVSKEMGLYEKLQAADIKAAEGFQNSGSKLETLRQNTQAKIDTLTRGAQIGEDIRGIDKSKYSQATLDEVIDGDTLKIHGQEGSLRFGGSPTFNPKDPKGWIDTPETYHGQFSESPKEKARVAKQQSTLGLKSPEEVYKAGELAKLDALYTLMGRPKDASGKEWTPGPIQYDVKGNPLQLGSKQNPLGLPIQEYQVGGHTKDGRGLGYFKDASGQQNLNARIAEQGMLSEPNTLLAGSQGAADNFKERFERNRPQPVGGTVQDVLTNVKTALRQRESGGDYKAVNKYGYAGAFQMGASVLEGLGMVKHGTSNKEMNDPANWTGKYGVKSLNDFLKSPKVQEALMDQHMQSLAAQIGPVKNTTDLGGRLAAAHLLGVEGSKNLDKTDANKTSGREYYKLGSTAAGLHGKDLTTWLELKKQEKFKGKGFDPINTAKLVAGGVVDFAASISEAPKKLYDFLGGDYLEGKGVYESGVKGIIEGMNDGAKILHAFNENVIAPDKSNMNALQASVGKAFDEGNYVSGILGTALNNPAGAIDFAANMYGFSKAMAAKGITSLPAVSGALMTNVDEASKIFEREHGRKPDASEKAAIMGLAAIGTAADMAQSKLLFDKVGGSTALNKITATVDDLVAKVPNSVARMALGAGGKVFGMMATEGAQEGFTEATTVLGGTQNLDKAMSPEYQKQIYTATALGAASGPGMVATNVVMDAAGNAVSNVGANIKKGLSAEGRKEIFGTPENAPISEIPTQAEPTKEVVKAKPVKAQLSAETILDAIAETEATLKAEGALDEETMQNITTERATWEAVAKAVGSTEVFDSLNKEIETTEDPARKAELENIRSKAAARRAKTIGEALENDPEMKGQYQDAINTLRGVREEGLGDAVQPGTILDILRATGTIDDIHRTTGVPKAASSTKQDKVQKQASDIFKATVMARLNKGGFQEANTEGKLAMLGEAVSEWGNAAGVDLENYRGAIAKPIMELVAETGAFYEEGTEPVSHAEFDIDVEAIAKGAQEKSAGKGTEKQQEQKVAESVKAKVKKDAKLFADEGLDVEDTSTPTHSGMSKGTINKLAEMFKIPASRVKAAMDIAFVELQIKKMGEISKASNAAQYEIYHGADGIVTNFMKYKAAMEKGDTAVATKAVNNLVKRYVDQMYKYKIAKDSIKEVQAEILAMPKDSTLADYKEKFADVSIGVQGATGSDIEYTITGMDIVKLTEGVPEEIRDAIKMKAGGQVLLAIKESVQQLHKMLNREFAEGEIELPTVSFNKRERSELQTLVAGKVIEVRKELEALEKAEASLASSDVAEDVIKAAGVQLEIDKVKKAYEKALGELKKLVASEVKNKYQYNNTTFKEEKQVDADLTERAGQKAGTINAEQAEKLGLTDAEAQIEEIVKILPVDAFKKILAKIEELKKEKAVAGVAVAKAYDKVNQLKENADTFHKELDTLVGKLDEKEGAGIRDAVETAKSADKAVRDLASKLKTLKGRAKDLEAVQKFLENSGEAFKDLTLNVENLLAVSSEFNGWLKGEGRNATTAEKNEKLKTMAKEKMTLTDTIFNVADGISKRAVVFMRKLVTGLGVNVHNQDNFKEKALKEIVAREIQSLAKRIDKLEKSKAETKKAQMDAVRTAYQAIKGATQGSKEPTMSLNAAEVKEVLQIATKMKKLKEQAHKSRGLAKERVIAISNKIKELQKELKGTALFRGSLNTNTELTGKDGELYYGNYVANDSKMGQELKKGIDAALAMENDPLDYSGVLKESGTLMGNLALKDILTLLDEGSEEADLVKGVINGAMNTLNKSKINTDAVPNVNMAISQLVENPALKIMTDIQAEGGKVNFKFKEPMVQALVLSTQNYLAAAAGNLAFNDAEAVGKILGVSEFDPAVKRAQSALSQQGRLLTIVAAQVGDDFARAMGIRQNEVGEEAYRKLIASLGNMGLILAEQQGKVEIKSMEADAWNSIAPAGKQVDTGTAVKFVHVKKENVKELQSKAKAFKKLDEVVNSLNTQSMYRAYSNHAVDTKKEYTIDKSFGDVPEKSKEVLRELEDQEYTVQIETLEEILDLYRGEGRNALMERAGWQDISKMDDQLFDDREAQAGKNMEIETSLEKLNEMAMAYKNGEITENVYFDWFFSGNGRYMIDAIGVNPQADKHFTRWLVVPKASVDVEWNEGKQADKDAMNERIAQAFGYDIDSSNKGGIDDFANGIIAEYRKDPKKFRKMVVAGEGLKTPHVGHAFQALKFLDKMEAAKGKPFKATLTVEYDAKTSGIMHKTMQAPIFGTEKTAEYLSKGAIMVDGDVLEGGNSSEHVSKQTDMYKMTALVANDKLEGLNGVEALEAVTKKGDYTEPFEMLKAHTTTLVEDGKVTKEGRKLSKEAFIPFGYASSVNTIKKNIGMAMAYDILKHVVNPSKDAEVVEVQDKVKEILGLNDGEFKALQVELRTKPAANVKATLKVGNSTEKRLLDILVDMFSATYGESYKYSMETQFSEHVELNEAIKDTTTALFGMWKQAYDKEIKKYPNVTVEDKKNVIRSLEALFPMVKAPWSEGRSGEVGGVLDTVAIFDTRKAKMGNEVLPTARTTTVKDGKTSSETVQAMILEMEKTFAAGAVLPIHWLDGTQIAPIMRRDGIQGIHDAIALGLDPKATTEAIHDMNKAMYDINRNYDMMGEFNLSLLGALDAMSDEDIKEFTKNELAKTEADERYEPINLAELKDKVGTMSKKVQEAREKMYSKPMTVGNIIAYEGTAYDSSTDMENYKNLDNRIAQMMEKCK